MTSSRPTALSPRQRAVEILRLQVPNFSGSRLFVASALLTSTGGGMLMAFLFVYFDRTTALGLATIGVAITVGRAIAAIVPALIGRLLDRVGPRKVAVAGDLITGVGFMLCVIAVDPLLIGLTQFLTQAGSQMFWTSSRGLVSLAANGEKPQTWFGLISSLRNAGLGLGTLVTSVVLSAGSVELLHGVVMICAVLFYTSSLALLIWKPASEEDLAPFDAGGRLRSATFVEVFSNPGYRGLLILNTGLVFAAMVIPLVVVVYTTDHVGLPAMFAGGLVITNTVLVALASTHVSAWTQSQTPRRNIARGYVLNLVSFALFCAVLAFAQSPILAGIGLIAAMLFFSIGEMVSTPASNVLAIDLAPAQNNGTHMAAFQLTWSLGTTISPAIFGSLLTVGAPAPWIVLLTLTIILGAMGFQQHPKADAHA